MSLIMGRGGGQVKFHSYKKGYRDAKKFEVVFRPELDVLTILTGGVVSQK